jgi:hypothetical protein
VNITLETDNDLVEMDAVLISRNVTRQRAIGGLLTTVVEVWRDVNGQAWEYTDSFVQPPMGWIGVRR